MAQGTRAVCDGRVEHAAVVGVQVVLGRAVQQDVHMCADVHVAQLECPSEGKDERDVLSIGQLLANDLNLRSRSRGETTR